LATDWKTVAEQKAKKYGLDPRIFIAQINQESGGRDVTSGAGAEGPAQFIPSTGAAYGLTSTTIHQLGPSLDAAARLMRDNLKKYGSYSAALSAYNSGRPDAYKDPNFAGGQTYNYVKTILGAAGTKGSAPKTSSPTTRMPSQPAQVATTTTTPGQYYGAQRLGLVQNFLSQGGVRNPNAISYLAQANQLQDVAPSTTTTYSPAKTSPAKNVSGQTPTSKAGTIDALVARANAINAQHLPYQWGGGHGAKVTNVNKTAPLDCSGAVSAVLGINPRVSGQFETWGKPGDGGSNGVTIYANGHHVLMKINGHFFGTSATNPGGGAGWIPQKAISPEYLKGFTARHE
jgi:hypothetical protein